MSGQKTLDEYGRQKRLVTTSNKKKEKAPIQILPTPSTCTGSTATALDDGILTADLQILRDFDLDYSYGPAIGITRLDRWKRAYELGLDPEPKVEELILQHGENSKYTEWMTFQGSQWEDLHKESRKRESEVDLKLLSFSKLASNYAQKDSSSGCGDDYGSTGHVFDTMALEISQLLTKLESVNENLNVYVSSISGLNPSATLYHTLQRHNAILQDYRKEFNRVKGNIVAQRQREELLGQVKRDYKMSSGLNRRTELYLKEHDHIQSTDRLAEDAISIAMTTKENLIHQKKHFSGIMSKVNDMTSRFPLINSVVQKINFRKRRDALILGGVIAVCMVVLLLFALG